MLDRSQAAEYLAKKLPIKSVVQWHSYLNDNAAGKNKPRIAYKGGGAGRKSLYAQENLDNFITAIKPPPQISRSAQLIEIYGMHHKENITSHGRALGWRDFTFSVYPISPDQQDDNLVVQVHIKTGSESDLKVGALTIIEAKAWLAELAEAVKVAERWSVKTNSSSTA